MGCSMNHLYTYESYSEPLSEIIEYIKDICLELRDEGFSVVIPYFSRMDNIYYFEYDQVISLNSSKFDIEINKFDGLAWTLDSRFEISETYNYICTIIGYMKSNGYRTNVKINRSDSQSAVRRINLNDITVVFDAVRNTEKAPAINLDGMGPVRYIKLYFTNIFPEN